MVEQITFTFPTFCEACQQKPYDINIDNTDRTDEQQLGISAIHEAGWPICAECGNDLEIKPECEIEGEEN